MKSIFYAILVLAATAGGPIICCAEVTFHPIGDLDGGEFASTIIELSGDGETAVGGSESADPHGATTHEPLSWTFTQGIRSLTTKHLSGEARGVSNDGAYVVGLVQADDFEEAFRWSRDSDVVRLGTLPGGTRSIANDVSGDGRIVVGYSTSDASPAGEAFVWTPQLGMEGLGDLPGGARQSNASAVSADARKAVGWGKTDEGTEAIVWDLVKETRTGLGDLPGGEVASFARDVSADGRWIVGDASSEQGQRAFLWEQATGFQDLGPGIAYSVSADGSLVAGSTGSEAFIWDPHNGVRKLKPALEDNYGLDLTGWKLTRAASLSSDGATIAGEGVNPQGDSEGWVVRFRQPQAKICENDYLPVERTLEALRHDASTFDGRGLQGSGRSRRLR